MRRSALATVAALCLVTLLAHLPALAGPADELTVMNGKKVYLVKPGDTLAGIAGKLFGDTTRWKEIWQANPQIRKPGLIFPGDTLVIGDAPPEVALGVREKAVPQFQGAAASTVPPPVIAPQEFMTGKWEQPEPEPIVLIQSVTGPANGLPALTYEACGYITTELPTASILGSPDGRDAMSQYDTVFINRGDKDGLTIGQEFRIIRPVRRIRDPRSGVFLGWLVKVVGRFRTDCLQKETATGQIVQSFDYAGVGDRLEPYTPVTVPSDHYLSPKLAGPCLPSSTGTEARLLASQDDRDTIGEGDVVYLNRGQDSGIIPGMRLAVYRQGLPGEKRGTYLVGELQVLLSQNATATALVTNSIYMISLNDRVETW